MPSSDHSLWRRFWRLTGLNILANVTVPLASLIDTALLGHLDDIRFLAGVALASVLFEYLYWTFGFLRMGTTGLTAQAVGRGDGTGVYLVLYRSLAFAWLAGGLLLVLQLPLGYLGFSLLGGTAEVENAGVSYFQARIWAAPASLSNFVFLGWFLGREESGTALLLTVITNVANIVANYILIVHLGLAAFGAGLGTTISQYLGFLVAIALFLLRPGRVPWRWVQVWRPAAIAESWRLNRDILIRTVALITAFAVFTNCSSLLGTIVLAANAVLQRLVMLAAYLIDGAAFATESLAGILLGERDRPTLFRLRRLALRSGVGLAGLCCVLYLSWPETLLRLLTTHEATVQTSLAHLPWLLPTLLIGAFAYIHDGLFLGLTAGRPLRNAMLVSLFLAFLPGALTAVRLGSNHLLWASMVTFMMARAVTLWRASRWLPAFTESLSAVQE
jgi:MATE family multidrug resistance protein